ncbi:hypothetical protein AJ85_17180 [Alkalihalobacillus alcalophilus ATCC 27647 = CGMCC 1.3604]|uniref:Uncharacterized protein n=1 Tax=Alkalihalobacillus alcalophilus ATCC 27647 = CGMCC 1.3604 TaxID=1218173 RepID=A0A094WGF0_ALKAL|nr:hypothetical protein [Alkalihalobacillus alcalophilus]KGA95861.1 hypothetical protein BALCAV_0219755 [Alkalihalobacillus alcalophilus ATCC 27647 = CGMCC 1.3604]MED1563962.1 hypothetical protein [Alkalihalobacillus alcalophilus]THG92095.1 hypothetical protein AJ85_17180 [Alkalihalobacillus alcalophilus ATCC 27647 = CGMCC 1.3604]
MTFILPDWAIIIFYIIKVSIIVLFWSATLTVIEKKIKWKFPMFLSGVFFICLIFTSQYFIQSFYDVVNLEEFDVVIDGDGGYAESNAGKGVWTTDKDLFIYSNTGMTDSYKWRFKTSDNEWVELVIPITFYPANKETMSDYYAEFRQTQSNLKLASFHMSQYFDELVRKRWRDGLRDEIRLITMEEFTEEKATEIIETVSSTVLDEQEQVLFEVHYETLKVMR